jgi:hypothetical protein
MAVTKREQQPFVYGSLSKEEIYLKAPAASAQAPAVSTPAPAIPAEDEKFWLAIQTSTVAGLYEELLAKYPRSGHATEARQRIKDLKATEVAALPSPAAAPTSDASARQGGDTKTVVRNLFAPEDSQKVAAIAVAQQLKLPSFTISPSQDVSPKSDSMFVGVWSNKRGWSNGKGRYAMLIITEVSATGLAKGFYLWGPPTKASWVKDEPGYRSFAEYVTDKKFSIGGTQVTVKLEKNVLALSSFKKEKPSETTSIELRPVWQLVPAPEEVEPSAKREKTSQPRAVKKEGAAEPRAPGGVGGASMEERYRACRKLVTGFARREACARTGVF